VGTLRNLDSRSRRANLTKHITSNPSQAWRPKFSAIPHLLVFVFGLQQPSVRKLEDQVGNLRAGEVVEGERENAGQTSRDFKMKKWATPPSESRKSSRPQKPRQL
jgi:hypothetical protein